MTRPLPPESYDKQCRKCGRWFTTERPLANPRCPDCLVMHYYETHGEWVHQARCGTVDPELWFPTGGDPATAAKRVCATCPVRQACEDHAEANGERFGIWGGKFPGERDRSTTQPVGVSPRLRPATWNEASDE